MNIRYLGFKDQLDIPAGQEEDPNLVEYRLHLSHLDGVFSALEDYFDATNPRLRNLFPDMLFNPLPIVNQSPILKDEQFLLVFKSAALSHKMEILSNFSSNIKANWEIDSISLESFWADEDYWLFEQDLADILVSSMQNLGKIYMESLEDSKAIKAILVGTRDSFIQSYKSLKTVREKLLVPTDSLFQYWIKLQDYSFDAYIQAMEYLLDFFTYCETKKALPVTNALLTSGY